MTTGAAASHALSIVLKSGESERLRAALAALEAAHQEIVQQERLRALGEMASGIAHDLNNALAPVVGFSELLLETPGTLEDPARARGYVELIHTAAQQASGMVPRLRKFYDQRRIGDAAQAVDVPPLVEQVVALTQVHWRDHALAEGRTIHVETALGAVPPVAGQPAELREALSHLIRNAVEALPGGGTITVGCRPGTRPGGVEVWVGDSGTGMSEETRRRCLEPFFSTKGEPGTGLGLPAVYGAVRRHGGDLTIESAPQRGTTVTMWLPVFAAPERRARAATGEGERPLRILVVDGDPTVRRVTEAFLAVDGHRVRGVSSGREALDEVHRLGAGPDGLDLVITDRVMPDMDGDGLAERVKALAPGLKVIFLTGLAGLFDESAVPAAVDAVLSKPVRLTVLRDAISRLVGRKGG